MQTIRTYLLFGLLLCLAVLVFIARDIRQDTYAMAVSAQRWVESQVPTPVPTPVVPPAEAAGEILIIVAEFNGRGTRPDNASNAAEYIYATLLSQDWNQHQPASTIRLDQYAGPVNDNTVKDLLEKTKATLVIWGWYDGLGITPRFASKTTYPDLSSEIREWSRDNDYSTVTTEIPEYCREKVCTLLKSLR